MPIPEPLALSIDEACKVARAGRTSIYQAIKAGQLRAVKRGRRLSHLPHPPPAADGCTEATSFGVDSPTSWAELTGIVRDAKYPNMYRLRLADGSLSDMNLTRARDALPFRCHEAGPHRVGGMLLNPMHRCHELGHFIG
jgi:excisionase family DNA binding protein